MSTSRLDSLRSEWSTLYSSTLPSLARAKDSAQSRWPVTLDHCFARIILDNTVGRGDTQWDNVIKKPAVKNMDEAQLKQAIELGEQIKSGQVNLVELDKKSLQARGKGETKYRTTDKRKRAEKEEGGHDKDEDDHKSSTKKMRGAQKQQSTLSFTNNASKGSDAKQLASADANVDEPLSLSTITARATDFSSKSYPNPSTAKFLDKIRGHASLTPYRKRLYSTLLSVPSGHYTTYQAMATFLNSSARAVGNGMRNNPYAPDVPCHRVLASDGSIGGFGGSWGEEGKHAGKKRDLLKEEGVNFDSRGRVKGPVFRNFEDLSTIKIV